jgi:DNA-binding winged helix-turn-helix (wHTH) protein
MIYVFRDYELDTRLYELRHSGEPCPLWPQVFNVLAYLMAHRDRVVTKDELTKHLWPTEFVSDATVHQHVTAARRAAGDSGRLQRVIKTLRGRGYRFIAPVEIYGDEALGQDEPVASEAAIHATRQVLPSVEQASRSLDGALVAERKLVTVLCGTLVNVVTLAERLGLEALPHLRQVWLDLVQREVQPDHGTLQAMGNDGFLVLFGVPVAQEDHARRAVLTGLALQRRFHQPYTDPVTQQEVPFDVCLGVHTGPVMVGSHASDPQQRAAPGMLLSSEDTLQLVHGEVRSATWGSVSIQGRPEPLKAYTIQAMGPRARDGRARRFAGPR